MINPKKLKIVKVNTTITPNFRLFLFSQKNRYKNRFEHIDSLCATDFRINKMSKSLESLVENVLVEEFSSDIKQKKSYDLLLSAIVHNIKKKQLDNITDDFIK